MLIFVIFIGIAILSLLILTTLLDKRTPEEIALIEKKEKEKERNEEERQTRRSQALENDHQKHRTIKKVTIIGNNADSRKSFSSTTLRGTFGGLAFGPAGLIGGALSGKNKTTIKTTFLIEYNDGYKETKTVDNNSYEFQNLCNYIEF